MSTNTNSTIYTGIWNDWSRGQITGSTLTLSNRNAAILIAILALFVSQAGSHSWTIICFITHQLRTTTKPRNGLFHQQQVILRNSVWGSDLGTIWQLGKLAWFWRGHGVRSVRGSIGILVLGILHLFAFFATGTLSSRIVTVGSKVLVRGPNCGIWNTRDAPTSEKFEFNDHLKLNSQLSVQYVRDCANQEQPLPECNIFKKLKLSLNSTADAECPFSDEMCVGGRDKAVRFDTGLMDSCNDLGINSEEKHRVQYRRVMTCSPVCMLPCIQCPIPTHYI